MKSQWQCQACGSLRTWQYEAAKCCPPQQVWNCERNDCEESWLHYNHQEAIDCAAGRVSSTAIVIVDPVLHN